MANLTSFKFGAAGPEAISIVQPLDFFESVSNLREINLTAEASPMSGGDDRLVSLERLETMFIDCWKPRTPLLDYLLIPDGAKIKIKNFAPLCAILADLLPVGI